MGADIYIKSISDKLQAKWEPKFREACQKRDKAATPEEKEAVQKEVEKYYDAMYKDGYFRDSYNGTSLFWLIGLSWWGLKLKDGYLPVESCKALLAQVQASEIPTGKKLNEYLAGQHVALDDGENSPAAWRKYFVNKRKTFIGFLNKAIKLNEPLRCSV